MSCVFIFLFISNVVISQSASRHLHLQTGASVTIPCPYDRKYIHHKKYWCYRADLTLSYFIIQAYANGTNGKVTVTDNPSESLFTVTMKDLQTGNTGWYRCSVEIEGKTPDVTEELYITVKADPDLSVRESRVSGDEGGSITVQCLYSAAYQTTQKKWCRFRDRSCNSVRRTDTSHKSAVHISDDGKSSFSVQMSGLKKSDGGWYWCSAGDLEVPVHISVRDPPPEMMCSSALHTTERCDFGGTENLRTGTFNVFIYFFLKTALLCVLFLIYLIEHSILMPSYKSINHILSISISPNLC
ncbi:CMRF35-like molecule 3 isoform X3 [Silurus meridionalis]|uniref:CMRF35-like molecule 3 isoform X3 n=1 Tax=Silurus meridionalis TaxID=175797 RepID=UPI001EEAD244|nr:CMRF35-like molecule 3 isoform X3 [Silurus meridionalis]